MFVPVGVLTGRIWRWRGLWVAFGLRAAIEILQLITARGLCEFDDVIHNMIGALIGTKLVIAASYANGNRGRSFFQIKID